MLSKTSLKTMKNTRFNAAIKRVQSFDLFESNEDEKNDEKNDERNIKTDRNNN